MSKKAVSEMIKDYFKGCIEKKVHKVDVLEANAELQERLEKLSGWIPCITEEWPKTDEYILLSFANFSIPIVGRYEEDEEGGAFYIGDETETCVSQDLIVNAWMPLPAPYREEEL